MFRFIFTGSLIIYIVFPLCSINGVQINFVSIPQAVQNNSGKPVVLDCDYTVRPTDDGLVVKWFLNGAPAAVYQWIPSKKPQGLGPLKNRLDLNYKASNNPNMMFRALRILNPTTDIAGEYKCFVSTFNDEDFSARYMTVFVPEEHLVLRQFPPERSQVNISCTATAVYPEPEIVLYKDPNRKSKNRIEDIEIWSRVRESDGRYDVTAYATVAEDLLRPSETVFKCEMTIPRTGYTKSTVRVYYPEGNHLFNDGQEGAFPKDLLLYGVFFGTWLIAKLLFALF